MHAPMHYPTPSKGVVITLNANTYAGLQGWTPVHVPLWATRMEYLVIGGGGNGGNGAVGANSTAAGGGGGGSGAQSSGVIFLNNLPKLFYASVGAAGQPSRLSISPDLLANNCIALSGGGFNGGNAAGATAGAAGAGANAPTIAAAPLAAMGTFFLVGGQAGIIGGTTVAGAALTIPTTGLYSTGGTGGGGLPAAAVAGTNGGFLSVPATGVFPSSAGGFGGAAATAPPTNGNDGVRGFGGLQFSYGGTGGGSSHGSATTTGLFGGRGGDGAIGSGGGGGGGALTGSVQGLGGAGGPGIIILTFS